MKPLFAVTRVHLSLLLCLCAGVAGQLVAQQGSKTRDKQSSDKQSQERLKKVRKALDEWLARESRDRDEGTRDEVVAKIMGSGRPGVALLSSRYKKAAQSDDPDLRTANHTIVCHIALRWLEKVEKSPTRFAGQYGDLLQLQPAAGEFYMQLLLNTPQWYPVNRRWVVIPALRDLYPKGPDRDTLDQFEIRAKNVADEPEHLRIGMSYALAQWGRRDLIKIKIRALEKQAESDQEELALAAKRDLAAILYGIRDYAFAAVAYRDFLRAAEAAETVYPVNYYNAACCMCLSGDRRSALGYLEKCLAINNAANVDPSMYVKRELFDIDPEIDLVRGDRRFIEMIDNAFGKRQSKKLRKGQSKAPR